MRKKTKRRFLLFFFPSIDGKRACVFPINRRSSRTRTSVCDGWCETKKSSFAGEAIETNEKRGTHLSESSEVGLRFEEARVGLHARARKREREEPPHRRQRERHFPT
jgi:hypothetical protein